PCPTPGFCARRPSWEHAAKEPQSRPWAIPHIRGLVCRGSRHRARGVPSRSSTVGGMKRGQGKAEQKQMRDGPLGASSRCRKPRKGRQRPSERRLTTTKCRVCGDQRDKILLAVSSLPSVQDDHTTRTAHITKAILIAEAPSLYGLAQCAMPWQLWHCERPAGSTQLSKVHAP
ncbi:unnamed protein product, partial [Prorocentrum cordatum]